MDDVTDPRGTTSLGGTIDVNNKLLFTFIVEQTAQYRFRTLFSII